MNSATFTVSKDFVPNDPASVTVSLSCTSGSTSPASAPASEATPASFTVTGYTPGTSCTATEIAHPARLQLDRDLRGHDRRRAQRDRRVHHHQHAQQRDLHGVQGLSCPDPASVTVSLSCTSGSATPATPRQLRERHRPAFTVTGYTAGATCTATESPIPAGYSSTGTCTDTITGAPSGTGSCTITNTLNSATFTVSKDFVPNDPASVTVSLSCTSGSAATRPPPRRPRATPAGFTVTGYTAGATCTATESPIPLGYSSTGTCADTIVGAPSGTGACTITNTLNSATFTVSKDFVPNDPASVTVSLSCTSGSATPATAPASEATPAGFTVTGYTAGATCTATESPIPLGYSSTGTCADTAARPGDRHLHHHQHAQFRELHRGQGLRA